MGRIVPSGVIPGKDAPVAVQEHERNGNGITERAEIEH